MGHPFARGEAVYDVTFENVQAGLRTDYLFRLANQHGGIVLGTGDLSELALGWCTYGVGDQMSHYNVNAGVPKTLIQHLIRWVIGTGQFDAEAARTLQAILDTEISPELVPADADAGAPEHPGQGRPLRAAGLQPVLHARYGLRPSKIAFLARHAWSDAAHGAWPPDFPEAKRNAYDLARSSTGWASSSCASSTSASSSARPCRTARRSRPAARSPRAATGARPPMPAPGSGSPSWSATFPKPDRHKRDGYVRLCRGLAHDLPAEWRPAGMILP